MAKSEINGIASRPAAPLSRPMTGKSVIAILSSVIASPSPSVIARPKAVAIPLTNNNSRVSDWYDRVVSSLDKCVFCDLKDKYILKEQDGMVLTVNLFPYVEGHLLIIPRRHIERFSELNAPEWAAVGDLIKTGVSLLKQGYKIDDTNILYREGGAGSGKSLGHLHFHIMPCVEGFLTRDSAGIRYNFKDLTRTPLQVAEFFRSFGI